MLRPPVNDPPSFMGAPFQAHKPAQCATTMLRYVLLARTGGLRVMSYQPSFSPSSNQPAPALALARARPDRGQCGAGSHQGLEAENGLRLVRFNKGRAPKNKWSLPGLRMGIGVRSIHSFFLCCFPQVFPNLPLGFEVPSQTVCPPARFLASTSAFCEAESVERAPKKNTALSAPPPPFGF